VDEPDRIEEEDWERKLRKWETIWPLMARSSSFMAGLVIMFWQTVLENADRPYLIGASVTMMGLPAAGWLASSLSNRRKGEE
jgi:hypothetical protein